MKPSSVFLFAGIMFWIIAAFAGLNNAGSWSNAAVWFILGCIFLIISQNQRRREK